MDHRLIYIKNMSTPNTPNMETCFKAVGASPKLYSITPKLMCI